MGLPIDTVVHAGDKLRKRMQDLGMNQTQLAKNAELTKTDVTRYLNGQISDPSMTAVAALGKALDLSPNEVFEMYGMWKPKQVIGDRRLDQLAEVLDRLTPENRYTVVSLVDLVLHAAESKLREQNQ